MYTHVYEQTMSKTRSNRNISTIHKRVKIEIPKVALIGRWLEWFAIAKLCTLCVDVCVIRADAMISLQGIMVDVAVSANENARASKRASKQESDWLIVWLIERLSQCNAVQFVIWLKLFYNIYVHGKRTASCRHIRLLFVRSSNDVRRSVIGADQQRWINCG